MKTKYLVRLLNRAAHLDADIELADVISAATRSGALATVGSSYMFDAVDPTRHPRLAARANSLQNRKVAIGHLNSSLCSSFIKDAYEDVTAYLQDILKAAARKGLNPNRLIGEQKLSLEANDILKAGNWHAVVDMVAKSVFRKLEKKQNTKDLIQMINDKLDLQVSQTTIDTALPFLELRHLLVHADGVADQAFCTRFPSFGAAVGSKIKLDSKVLLSARNALISLVREFDDKIIEGDLVSASEMQP